MKNILLCFIESNKDKNLEEYLSHFDKKGFEIHIFDSLNNNIIKPHNIPDILDYYFKDRYNKENFYILSDVEDFLKLIHRLYNQSFNCFIYYKNNIKTSYDVELERYIQILNSKIEYNEVNTHIYTNIKNDNNGMIYLDDIDKILHINKNVKFIKY